MHRNRSLLDRIPSDFRYFVVTARGVEALDDVPLDGRPEALTRLIDQEMLGRRREHVPQRVKELCRLFGFEWESASEPGHMRYLPRAAFMLDRARLHARNVAQRASQRLAIPFVQVEGVNVVDASATLMHDYLALIANEPGIYGTRPYRLADSDRHLMLRQTGCLQKFSICKTWTFTRSSLPIAVFEISDSYRREAIRTLQLCSRLRRFHLPETHVHTRTTLQAMALSLELHELLLEEMAELSDDCQLFISAPHAFVASRKKYLRDLAATMRTPALLKVYPAGSLCQDGVEVDVEYKIRDSSGCPREFSTFQIDERITRSFGLQHSRRRGHGSDMATIHVVFSSSLERYLYFVLDRIASLEAAGRRATLPLWLSPIVVRVIPSNSRATTRAIEVADYLATNGVRADIDDRNCPSEEKVVHADAELIPFQILVDVGARTSDVRVRSYESCLVTHRDIDGLIAGLRDEDCARVTGPLAARMSQRPFAES